MLYLKWRSGEKQSEGRDVVGVENLRQLTVVVLHAMALVYDHVPPAHLQKISNIYLYILAKENIQNI